MVRRLLPLLFLSVGCATPTKTIVLSNMPRTIVIHRGHDVAEKQCNKPRLWGCAQRFPSEDKCVMSLDYDRDVGVTVHELAHCAGEDEESAKSLTSPERE